jgi:hypothetical protein
MKAGVLLAAVLVFTAPVPAAAQQWTANEQSLLEHIRMCWDGIGKMSYGRFAVECNFDPEVAYWWTEESAPSVGIDWWRPNAQANWARLQVIAQDLRPIRITQHGDMYFVFFVGLRTFAEADGTPQQNEWQGFERRRATHKRLHRTLSSEVHASSGDRAPADAGSTSAVSAFRSATSDRARAHRWHTSHSPWRISHALATCYWLHSCTRTGRIDAWHGRRADVV